ncbi:FAD-binding oxidoreductase [Embleya sp. NBC_00896]|uniref:NAD(P)/FAD-dependent oxidoreductase n=1 Tax=Embleya sp. NBC_00896 TaxID=2975961 RepID=UPI002F9110CB|nr:FAD-binding oxidoreductase [Embleya sp. NBC_00896]
MESHDVLVVGGGLLGCALAYHLARAGATVLLIEKDQLNRHASGQNAGSLHFQLEYRMIRHGRHVAERAAEALPLHLDAMRSWESLEDELGEPCGVRRKGGLMLAESPDQMALLAEKAALETARGLDVELLDAPATHRLAPYLSDRVVGATWCPGEGKANPRLATHAYARAAGRFGARIRAATRLTALRHDGRRWLADTEPGPRVAASAVVAAAGIWTGEVAAMADIRLPVVPVALSMAVTAAAPPLVPHLIQHAGRRLSLKQTDEGNILVGGGWPAKFVQHAGALDLDARPEPRLDSVFGSADAARVVPAVQRLPVLRIWTGATSLTPDQLPILGAVPRRPGFYVATGGSGFTLGPTYSRLLAELILGESTALPIDDYSPARFGSVNFV